MARDSIQIYIVVYYHLYNPYNPNYSLQIPSSKE